MLPGGDIGILCDSVVEEVHELMGFDEVTAYKFHEDEHGEVVAKIRHTDLKPYMGLHYPATDIPQATHFLFMKIREVGIAEQVREKHILRTHTLLCDMLLRNAPIGIVSQATNIIDLMSCDGAALYYGKKCWLLGTTPIEAQLVDIAAWFSECHRESTGLSTDSLAKAGYTGVACLGDAVCYLAAEKIIPTDFLFI
ncbi:hypothetical protein L7F22_064334 [Adiantum nelumboides]|nr:hypothetical protein [Adiantum nelumboides]